MHREVAAATGAAAREYDLLDPVDVVVIGAGPTGLYAAYYAGFRGLSVILIDSLPALGGQIATLYPEKTIADVAGFVGVRGQDFVDALTEQALQYQPTVILGDQVETLVSGDDHVELSTTGGRRVWAGAVLIAAGVGNFTPRALTEVDAWLGRGASYFVPRPQDLAGQDVVVVGGGDSAFDWALALHGVADSVSLVHRRPQFRCHQALIDAAIARRIPLHTPYEVVAVTGNHVVDGVQVQNRETGEQLRLPAQAVVAALGFIADLGPMRAWGLEMSARGIAVDQKMQTSRPRVFAAGDIAEYDGKIKLISVGFGEAATAINHAATLIDPGAELFPGHSTDAAVT